MIESVVRSLILIGLLVLLLTYGYLQDGRHVVRKEMRRAQKYARRLDQLQRRIERQIKQRQR